MHIKRRKTEKEEMKVVFVSVVAGEGKRCIDASSTDSIIK
jgi:hypothetical protein